MAVTTTSVSSTGEDCSVTTSSQASTRTPRQRTADSLRREEGLGRSLSWPLYRAAVARSITQLLSFLVNAAKGTPVASFTGAPELLAALTDITSFAAGRATTYTLVLLFYMAVVSVVVWGCNRLRARIAGGAAEGRS